VSPYLIPGHVTELVDNSREGGGLIIKKKEDTATTLTKETMLEERNGDQKKQQGHAMRNAKNQRIPQRKEEVKWPLG